MNDDIPNVRKMKVPNKMLFEETSAGIRWISSNISHCKKRIHYIQVLELDGQSQFASRQ